MGVTGLTTFIAKYHDKYKESVYLQNCAVVIDGSNLMYFLNLEERHCLFQPCGASTPKKKGYRSAGASGKSPVAKTNGLKEAHLFGGDYITYVQNVREFFQKLKLCNVTPIVLFDGAYDDFKIKTAYKRFAESIQDNVRHSENRVKGTTPGKTYAPVFMKTAFVEILQEQKILHFQTEGEADCTIAFVARMLGNCAILSSDSDFQMYVDAVVLPLNTLRFKKVTPKRTGNPVQEATDDQNNEKTSAAAKTEKIWTLHSQFLSLRNLCDKKFNMKVPKLLLVAPVILGNDYMPRTVFQNFTFTYSQNRRVIKFVRIAFLLKWLGQQRSFDVVLQQLINSIPQDQRHKTEEAVRRVIHIYEGFGGEEYVWNMLLQGGKIDEFVKVAKPKEEDECGVEDLVSKLTLEDDEVQTTELSEAPNDDDEDNTSDLEDSDSDLSEECEVRNDLFIRDLMDDKHNMDISRLKAANKIDLTLIKPLPEWYLESHVNCIYDTYLLKIIRNKQVFLIPQIEAANLPSSHNLSIPIIKVLGGILLDKDDTLVLITRSKSKISEQPVEPVRELPNFGSLPNLHEAGSNFRKMIKLDQRCLLILDTLGLGSPKEIEFIEAWPVSLRIWVMSVIYFIRNSQEESNGETGVRQASIPVALAILFSVLKNSVLNPPASISTKKLTTDEMTISQLLVETDAVNLSKLRQFYAMNEEFDEVTSRGFKRSYDILRPYNFSRFSCILYHLSHLNKLMGDPFRAPKVSYNINTWFIYKFSGTMGYLDEGLLHPDEFDYKKFIEEIATDKLGCLVDRILKMC